MATVQDCEQALHELAARMAARDPVSRRPGLDRTLSCTLRDLHVTFAGRLHGGQLTGIEQVDRPTAQIRLTLTSDDLVALVDGRLKAASAWATGRLKVDAGVRDMMKLRSLF